MLPSFFITAHKANHATHTPASPTIIITTTIVAALEQKGDIEMSSLGSGMWAIDRRRIRLGDKLGNGAFGDVFKAWIRNPGTHEERTCAAKTLKAGAPEVGWGVGGGWTDGGELGRMEGGVSWTDVLRAGRVGVWLQL